MDREYDRNVTAQNGTPDYFGKTVWDDMSSDYDKVNCPHYFLLVFALSHDTVEICKTNYVFPRVAFTPGHRRTPRPASSRAMVSNAGHELPLRMSEMVEEATADFSATPLTLR
nr:hypothetical protein [Corynebacterium urealyticum]